MSGTVVISYCEYIYIYTVSTRVRYENRVLTPHILVSWYQSDASADRVDHRRCDPQHPVICGSWATACLLSGDRPVCSHSLSKRSRVSDLLSAKVLCNHLLSVQVLCNREWSLDLPSRECQSFPTATSDDRLIEPKQVPLYLSQLLAHEVPPSPRNLSLN